jgi:hypothetical protein
MTLTAAGRLLLGTTTESTFLLDVNGTARVSGQLDITNGINLSGGALFKSDNTSNLGIGMLSGGSPIGSYFALYGNNNATTTSRGGVEFVFDTRNSGTGGFNVFGTDGSNFPRYFKIFVNGNTLIQNGGTFTDAGFKLDVQGTARVTGAMTVSGLLTASTGLSVFERISLYSDGVNGVIAMQTLTNTLNLLKYVKVVGDDGTVGNNNASAAFQIDGTNRGFLPPRMTTTQKNAIGTPSAGLQVYDTTLNQMSYYNGTTWVNF